MIHRSVGHLYVIDGDLQQLAVDAWLLPTDPEFRMTNSWAATLQSSRNLQETVRVGWDDCLAVFLENIDGADVWLGNVGRTDAQPEHYLDVALEFLTRASDDCRERADLEGRIPILALNHVGTGQGGGYDHHATILSKLISGIRSALNRGEIVADVVLVAWGEQPESASQYFRATQSAAWQDDLQWDFGARSSELHRIAIDLAERARLQQLSIFLGAGTSVGAGLPSWKSLLMGVAQASGTLADGENLDDLLDLRDQAALIDVRLRRSGSSIHEQLSDALAHTKYSLQHGLLASLPCNEFITTNVDELFEKACRANGRQLTVMPNTEGDARRWLLKLHGTVSEPEGMVFTRENYLDAGRSSRALLGLVQAMLFTRHMLFVGYGLADEDFHELVYEVRKAYGNKPTQGPIGTVLLLTDESLKSEIWSDTLRVVPVGSSQSTSDNARDIARFLDLVGMLSAEKHMFFLDRRYAHPSTDNERALDTALRELPRLVTDKDSPIWHEVETLLRRLGWDPDQVS